MINRTESCDVFTTVYERSWYYETGILYSHWRTCEHVCAGALVSTFVIRGAESLIGVILAGAWFPLTVLLLLALRIFLLAKVTELAVFLYEKHAGPSENAVSGLRFYFAATAGVIASGLFTLWMVAWFPFLPETPLGLMLLFLKPFIYTGLAEGVLCLRRRVQASGQL